MPLYDYRCSICGSESEVFQHGFDVAECCGTPMVRVPSGDALIKIKGAGGYPSRQKQIRNTTYRKHPQLEHEPNRVYL